MAFISIPNTFVSGSTFIASDVNENFAAITDGLSDGSKDLAVSIVSASNSANVASDISVNSVVVSGTLSISSDATFQTDTNFEGSLITKNFGFGPYAQASIASSVFTPTSSYVALSRSGNLVDQFRADYINAENMPVGTILILALDPASSGSVVLKNQFDAGSGTNYRMQLGVDSITLDTVYDKLVLKLIEEPYGGLFIWAKLSFTNT